MESTQDAVGVRRIAGGILLAIAIAEVIPLVFAGGALRQFLRPQPPAALAGALLVAALYIGYATRIPGIRARLGDRSWVRIPALLLAVVSGIFEELFFRRWLMDTLHDAGVAVALQIVVSALAFGAVHAFWGLRAGWRVVAGVCTATGALGAMLAILYVAGGRNVVPCIIAHFLINAVLEPALMLTAVDAGFARRKTWSSAATTPRERS